MRGALIEGPETLGEKIHVVGMGLARKLGIRESMRVLDVGCGQGTFTVCVAKLAGGTGKVVAVDITDEYLKEMYWNLDEHKVRRLGNFVRADAASLSSIFAYECFDVASGYRLVEELVEPGRLPEIIVGMTKSVRQDGTVAIMEPSTETRSPAEENMIRLHRDIGGDYFPAPEEILEHMRSSGLKNVRVEKVETDIWYPPAVFLKGAWGQDKFWREFGKRVMEELWPSVKRHGMRYPMINVFSGQKSSG